MTFVLTLADVSAATWSAEFTSVPKVLGRAESADIRLDHGSVSRQHCQFWKETEALFVEDCDSTNGTWVNGERIEKQRLSSNMENRISKRERLACDSNRFVF